MEKKKRKIQFKRKKLNIFGKIKYLLYLLFGIAFLFLFTLLAFYLITLNFFYLGLGIFAIVIFLGALTTFIAYDSIKKGSTIIYGMSNLDKSKYEQATYERVTFLISRARRGLWAIIIWFFGFIVAIGSTGFFGLIFGSSGLYMPLIIAFLFFFVALYFVHIGNKGSDELVSYSKMKDVDPIVRAKLQEWIYSPYFSAKIKIEKLKHDEKEEE
jgi:hypothetical protein